MVVVLFRVCISKPKKGEKMSRSQKQLTVLNYLLITKPQLTVGQAAHILNQWEFKCGNIFDVKG